MLKLLLSSYAGDIAGPEPKPDMTKYLFLMIGVIATVIIAIAIITNIIEKAKDKKEDFNIIIICNNCKATVSEKDTFCPKCGTRIKKEPNNKNKY